MVNKPNLHWVEAHLVVSAEGALDVHLLTESGEGNRKINTDLDLDRADLDLAMAKASTWAAKNLEIPSARLVWEAKPDGIAKLRYHVDEPPGPTPDGGMPPTVNEVVRDLLNRAEVALSLAVADFYDTRDDGSDTWNGGKCWHVYEALGVVNRCTMQARARLKEMDADRGWHWITRKGD